MLHATLLCMRCQHYEANKAAYVARAAARKMKVVIDLNERLCEYFASHPCVDCGEPDPVVLEFDHVAEKSDEVATMVRKGHSWRAILQEIAKCEVRCANCHRRVTAKRANWIRYRLSE